MKTITRHLKLALKDGSRLDRYVRITESGDAATLRRKITLMLTPTKKFGPETDDTSYEGCGVKTAQNVARWFGIDTTQIELRNRYVETSDMTKWPNFFLMILDFLTPFLDVPGFDPKIMTTPAQLTTGIRSVLDTRFDRRYKIVRHTGADKEATVARIEHYLQHGFPAVALACDGSHWVTIAGIETVRRVADGTLTDVTFTVLNNSSTDSWSWHELNFWFSDSMDAFAEAARDAGYTSFRQGTLIGARFDQPAHQYSWTPGWSSAHLYGGSQGHFLFLLKHGSGEVHIHRMQENGGVGERVAAYTWSSGWNVVELFQTKRGLFLFLLKEESGEVHIHKMQSDGKVGDRVATYNWSSGWNVAAFYTIGSVTCVLLLKTQSGEVHLHRMNDDGSLGELLERYDWSSGWSMVKPYTVNGKHYLMLVKSAKGTVHLHRIGDDGRVGEMVAEYEWSSGWTVGEFFRPSSKTLLLLHKAGDPDGLARIHEMNDDGTVGRMTDDAYWMSESRFRTASGSGTIDMKESLTIQSWPVLKVFSTSPDNLFLFQLCPLDGQVEIHPISTTGTFNDGFSD